MNLITFFTLENQIEFMFDIETICLMKMSNLRYMKLNKKLLNS